MLEKGFADDVDDEAARAVLDVVGRVFGSARFCIEAGKGDDGGPVAYLDDGCIGHSI
jgi:hypothetical protein